MKKLDILFVHPNAAQEIYQGLANEHSAIEMPIWAALLANHVRSRGHSCQILDCEVERLTVSESAQRIVDENPKVVCFVVYGQQPSASSQNMAGATKIAAATKLLDPQQRVLFVGGHVAALPKEVLETESAIDFVCQNEGVYTIGNLLNVTDMTDESLLSRVKGLGFKNADGHVILNAPEAIVPRSRLAIDLPGMAWDLLPNIESYRTAGWHSWTNGSEKTPFAALYTSLGCPYRCDFCMINIINRTNSAAHISSADSNKFRYWDPNFIIGQFDAIAKLGIKNVKIADELFVLNPRHFEKICDLIIERGYDFNIWAYSRVDTCQPQYLDKLKRAGVNWLGLGIENPNTVLRQEIHKDSFQEVRIVDVLRQMSDAGIAVGGNYIFGLPMDTEASMKETLQFAMENLTEMSNMYSAMAYPGSPLYLAAKKGGLELPDRYSGYSQHSYWTKNLASRNLTSEQILRFRDEAWMTYHTNPKYLALLESKYGLAAMNNVKSSTTIKLKRKSLGDKPPSGGNS
jgi:anaerobic magnesium-protoporphyrin IX monomethyl ester cyclase